MVYYNQINVMLNIPPKPPKHSLTNPNLKTISNNSQQSKRTHNQLNIYPSLELKMKAITQSNRELGEQRWQFLQNRRESHLNSMFNRRKTILETISRKNRNIYQRILSQQAHYNIQKINKEHNQNEAHPETISLAERSKALLSISRQAMVNSFSRPVQNIVQTAKNHSEGNELSEDKQNMQLDKHSSRLLQPISKTKGSELDIIKDHTLAKIVESRYLQSTSRVKRCLPLGNLQNIKIRACSVDRKRNNDIFINF